MNKLKLDNNSRKIQDVQFSTERSFRAVKSAIASSSYEGFNPKSQSVRIIRDVVEGRETRASLIASLKSDSLK